jgi:hypothetical protein
MTTKSLKSLGIFLKSTSHLTKPDKSTPKTLSNKPKNAAALLPLRVHFRAQGHNTTEDILIVQLAYQQFVCTS